MNSQIAMLDGFDIGLNFSDNFNTANNTDIASYNNWKTFTYDAADANVLSARINTNALYYGCTNAATNNKVYQASHYQDALKLPHSGIKYISATCKISGYQNSNGADGALDWGYHIGFDSSSSGNTGIKIQMRHIGSTSVVQLIKESTVLASAVVVIGNTDGNYWYMDFEYTKSSTKIYVYQGTKPTTPTVTYTGDALNGIADITNKYCGICTGLQSNGSYTTLIGRLDDYSLQIIL